MVIESHLIATGGITKGNLRAWVANFVNHINHWEEVVMQKLREMPTDSQISRGEHPIASIAGNIIGGAINVLLGLGPATDDA